MIAHIKGGRGGEGKSRGEISFFKGAKDFKQGRLGALFSISKIQVYKMF